jgi:hypothetical protein
MKMEIKKKKAIMKTIKNVNGGFYESNKEVNKKVSLKNDQLNGLSLFYKKTKLLEPKKYSMGNKIKE